MTTKAQLTDRIQALERELKDALETRSRAIDEAIDIRTRLEAVSENNDRLFAMCNERGERIDELTADLQDVSTKLDIAIANRIQWQRAHERTWEVKSHWYEKAKEYEQEIERLKSVISGRDQLLHDQAVNHTAINEKQQARIAQLIEERNALKQATPTAEELALVAANRDDMKACVQDALHWLRETRIRFAINERAIGALILIETMLAAAISDDIPF